MRADRKDVAGAETACREAIRLHPRYACAHTSLGNVLNDRTDLDGAEAAYREAIRLNPKVAMAHANLGIVLHYKKDPTWLRADLAVYRKQAASADAAERATAAAKIARRQADADLSGVREPGPLAKLPDAERSEWEKLWADVKAALAGAKKPPPPGK